MAEEWMLLLTVMVYVPTLGLVLSTSHQRGLSGGNLGVLSHAVGFSNGLLLDVVPGD